MSTDWTFTLIDDDYDPGLVWWRPQCSDCAVDLLDSHLEIPVDDRGSRIAYVDEDENYWCVDCFDEWFDANAEEAGDSCMVRMDTASFPLWHATCTGCDEGVWDQGSWCAHDEHRNLFCCWCWDAWEDAGTDTTDCGSEEPMLFCTECDELIVDSESQVVLPFVVDEDTTRYCVPCWNAWEGAGATAAGAAPLAAHKRSRDESGNEQSSANAQRNDDNIARLREWYPQYCSYHLYFHHVRGREQGCKFGDTEKCTRGSHKAPPGLALKARDLDLSVDS